VAQLIPTKELLDFLREHGVGDYTDETIRYWRTCDPPIPCAKPGKRGQSHQWDVSEVLDWLHLRRQSEKKGWTAPNAAPSPEGKDPLRHWQAQIKRTEYLEKVGKLVDAAAIEAAITNAFINVRARLLSVAPSVAVQCEGKSAAQIQKLIDDKIREGLDELCIATSNQSLQIPPPSLPAPPSED
jgi:hypothetical protein